MHRSFCWFCHAVALLVQLLQLALHFSVSSFIFTLNLLSFLHFQNYFARFLCCLLSSQSVCCPNKKAWLPIVLGVQSYQVQADLSPRLAHLRHFCAMTLSKQVRNISPDWNIEYNQCNLSFFLKVLYRSVQEIPSVYRNDPKFSDR